VTLAGSSVESSEQQVCACGCSRTNPTKIDETFEIPVRRGYRLFIIRRRLAYGVYTGDLDTLCRTAITQIRGL
jgi:hypothetical protein